MFALHSLIYVYRRKEPKRRGKQCQTITMSRLHDKQGHATNQCAVSSVAYSYQVASLQSKRVYHPSMQIPIKTLVYKDVSIYKYGVLALLVYPI